MRAAACLSLLLPIWIALGSACGKSPTHAPYWSQLQEVGAWLTGSFRCDAPHGQADAPRAVRLDIVEFHPEPDDSGVLYAEWAYADALGEPLRQQVLHLQRFDDGSVAVVVFDLRDAKRHAGAWRSAQRLATLKTRDLVECEACLIRLERQGRERFVGQTLGTQCPGPEIGDAYGVTKIEVSPDRLVWSTQGFDTAGRQVSGHGDAGDVYVKIANRPLR